MRATVSVECCLLLASSCSGPGGAPPRVEIQAYTEESAKPWTGLQVNDPPEDFAFVVVTDRTGGHREGVFESAMPKVNLLEPAFVVSVGDLIEGYTDDPARLDAEWDEVQGFIRQLEVPFFYTVGNHDMSNAVMAETWRRRFGPSFYHFTYKDVLFLVLNSELFGMVGNPSTPVPGPFTQPEQMQFVARTLKEYAQARWTIVLLHQPLWDNARQINADWLKVEEWLQGRPHTVFAGHFRQYTRHRRNNQNYVTLATTGGGSRLRGTAFGEFDHVALVTMTAQGPRIANLMLDGIEDVDVATPETHAAAEKLERIVRTVPKFVAPRGFERGSVELAIENPGGAMLTAMPRFIRSGNLEVTSQPSAIQVPPGESGTLRAELRASNGDVAMLQPARAIWSIETKIGPRTARFETTVAVLPVARYGIPKAGRVTIDGKLDEWPRLPFEVQTQGELSAPSTTPDDISFRFAVARDAESFYLAVDVTDDSIVQDASAPANEQDGLTISIDPRPAAERDANKSLEDAFFSGDLARISYNLIALGDSTPTQLQRQLQAAMSVATRAVARTDRGYSVELAVPAAFLDERQGESWRELRMTIHANDLDERGGSVTTLHWQPYRFGPAPAAGTGAFVKSE